MNLLYLFRAGLGIPDYSHPPLEIQDDFQRGEIGRYPISMAAKADYVGKLSDEGVPVFYLGDQPCTPPVDVVLYGLGSYDALLDTGADRYRGQLRSVLTWLKGHSVPLGDGIGWANEERLPVFRLSPPWFSAIAQGFALSLFVRAHQMDSSGPWSEAARQTWRGYHLPIDEGGFRRETEVGIVYEEYPGPELDFVFNGMCHALIGLWEGWRTGVVPDAKEDFAIGVKALRGFLHRFDYKGWSLYSLNSCLGKPLLASPFYHRANGLLAQIVGLMAGEAEIRTFGERWTRSSESITRRVRMSLRIGLDRYLRGSTLPRWSTSTRKR